MCTRFLPLFLVSVTLSGASLAADTYPRQPVDVEHYRFRIALSDDTDPSIWISGATSADESQVL